MTIRRHITFASLLALVCCSDDPPQTPSGAMDATVETGVVVYVATDGDDDAVGTRSDPFRTIPRALRTDAEIVFVRAGTHTLDGRVDLSRPVQLLGEESTRLQGILQISAEDVRVAQLSLAGRVTIDGAEEVELAELTVTSSSGTAIEILDSVVAVVETELSGDGQRGLRADSSTVTVFGLRVTGFSNTQVQASQGRFEAERLTLADGPVGLSMSSGVVSEVRDSTIGGMATFGAVFNRSQSKLTRVTIGANGDSAYGVIGADLVTEDCTIAKSGFGVISISNHIQRDASVQIRGGTITHGNLPAVTMGQGSLHIAGTTFEGGAPSAGDDALVIRNAAASLVVEGAIFRRPSSFAIGVYEGATGDITNVTIEEPTEGGLALQSDAPQAVRTAVVRGCSNGPGFLVFSSTQASLVGLRAERCAGGGVLVSEGARATIDGATLADNPQFGLGAFGGSHVTLSGSTISGSPQATLVLCNSGAQLVDSGDNSIQGTRSECP